MGLRIGTNLASLSAQRSLVKTSHDQLKHSERIASGQRVHSASDDPAGLAIADKMTATVRSLQQARRNAEDAVSFVQVAEGGMSEMGGMIVRARELMIQAASDTVGDAERRMINEEVKGIRQEIDRLANATTFNGVPLLNGEAPKSDLDFQVGIYNNEASRILMNAGSYDLRTSALGIDGISSESIDSARDSLDSIDKALETLNERRASLGALQNRLHTTANSLDVAAENQSYARSRIADADMAAEMSELVSANVLQQAGVAMLAQANQTPYLVMKIL